MIKRIGAYLRKYAAIVKTINQFSPRYIIITIIIKTFTLFNSYLLLHINKLVINELSYAIVSHEVSILSIVLLLTITGLVDIVSTLLFNVLQYNLGKLKMKYDDDISLNLAMSFSQLDMSYYDIPEEHNKTQHAGKCKSAILDSYNSLLDLIFAVFSFVVAFVVALRFSIWVLILAIVSAIPGMLVRRKLQMLQYSTEKQLLNDQRQVNYYLGLFFNKNVELEMQLYGFSDYIKKKVLKKQEIIRDVRLNISLERAKKEGALVILNKFFYIMQQVIMVVEIIKRSMTIGDYTYYGGIINNLSSSVNGIVTTINGLHINTVKYDEYIQIISRQPKLSSHNQRMIESKDVDTITFDHVSFCYPNTNTKVLNNLCFSIKLGDKIAIVGQNGAGKTTLVKLLLRFYDPTEGQILLNGINIKEYDIRSYRRLFSTMFQEPLVYMMSVKENVAISDVFLPDEIISYKVNNILSDLKMSDVNSDKINIDKYCGKEFYSDGYVFSVGQKQRIHAARTLFHDSALYVLDEPAASMDAISEADFLNALVEHTCGKSAIYITHRYNNLYLMDNILVLDRGVLAESGKHLELISNNGLYSHMFKLQREKSD